MLRFTSLHGTVPMYGAIRSFSCWTQRDTQLEVAGVPPDYFSETGQLWGNPLYNWPKHTATGYEWWIERIKYQLTLTDFLRIDHFKRIWPVLNVPYGEETAINGEWKPAPRYQLLPTVTGKSCFIFRSSLRIWVRSTILLSNYVTNSICLAWRSYSLHLRIRKKMIFFHIIIRNCVCYTGTHDNDTTLGWYQKAYEASKDKASRYFPAQMPVISAWSYDQGMFLFCCKYGCCSYAGCSEIRFMGSSEYSGCRRRQLGLALWG